MNYFLGQMKHVLVWIERNTIDTLCYRVWFIKNKQTHQPLNQKGLIEKLYLMLKKKKKLSQDRM